MSILIVLILFFLIVIWLLSVPIEINLTIDTNSTNKLQFRTKWLYGLVTFQSSKFKLGEQTNKGIRKTKKTRKYKKKQKPSNNGNARRFILAMIKSKGFLKRIIQFISDCIKSIRFRDTQISVLVGLGDPADTGNIVAILAPIFLWLRLGPISNATFEADYYHLIFRFTASAKIRVIPLDYVRLIFCLLISPTLWRSVISGIVASSK